MKSKFLASMFLITTPVIAIAAEWQPSDERPDLPMDSFVLPEGLEVTLWAASPDVFNPTNMDFDHKGRAWVLEGVNYRGREGRRSAGDRVMILEDTDGDGTADSSRVFWQDPELIAPLGIGVFDNVVMISQPPHLLKLTDVNRDLKFDPADGDTREVLLTGFNGRNHDHSLHSVTGTPDGRLMFNQGNCGGIFTDQSGREFPIGSAYYKNGGGQWPFDTISISGKPSADGFSYVGGFTAIIDPDGKNARIIGHGYRNSYEQTMTSMGHVFQNDNDDPPACRNTHVIEGASAGFFSPDGKRFWNADRRPGQDVPTAEWRQEDPGIMPAGDVYGGGSPTGVAFYENGSLGEKFVGTYLSCEAGKNVVFGYQPEPQGAGFKLDRTDFFTTNPQKDYDGADFTGGVQRRGEDAANFLLFRPSDVSVGPDGAIYVSDWFDPRVGGHDTQNDEATGGIYRITLKGENPTTPDLDLSTLEGAIAALESPAVNVRWLGFQALKAQGAAAFGSVEQSIKNPNRFIAVRGIWLLPFLGEKGTALLDKLLTADDEMKRLTAFRAIRHSGTIDALPYARKLARDESAAVRAEAALEMKYREPDESMEVLQAVAAEFDGVDRSYLESLGLGAGQHTDQLWTAIQTNLLDQDPLQWDRRGVLLAWRMMAPSAVSALAKRAGASELSREDREFAVDSLAFVKSPEAVDAMIAIAQAGGDLREKAMWWLTNGSEGRWSALLTHDRIQNEGLIEEAIELVEIIIPAKPESTKFTVADVLALEGDAAKGKVAAASCVICHQIDEVGPDYGPSLKGFASRQPAEVIAKSIIDPSADISQGFEGTAIELKDGRWIDGQILADADPVISRSTGGVTQKIPRDQIQSRHKMERSLMLSADQLGLSAQDVADILAWMKTY